MIEEAFVESAQKSRATVKLIRPQACEKCKACQGSGKNEPFLDAENTVGAKPRDRVMVEIDDNLIAKTTFMFYGMPFLGFIIGVLLGHFFFAKIFNISYHEVYTLASAILASLLFYMLNRKLVRDLAGNINIRIVAFSDNQ